jgi:hypothetical protein
MNCYFAGMLAGVASHETVHVKGRLQDKSQEHRSLLDWQIHKIRNNPEIHRSLESSKAVDSERPAKSECRKKVLWVGERGYVNWRAFEALQIS